MPLSDTTRNGIENWFTSKPTPETPSWSERIRDWIVDWIGGGIARFIHIIEPEGVNASKTTLTNIRNMPGVPQEVRDDIDKMLPDTGLWGLVAAVVLVPLMLIPMVFALFQPLGKVINYAQERWFHSGRMDPLTAIQSYWRGFIDETRLRSALEDHGFDSVDVDALIEVAKFIPNADEQTLWLAREVFEPAMVTKYGLDDELPVYADTDFAKIGVSPEQMANKWRAHWEHPGLQTIIQLLRRTDFSEADMREWFRLVEIPPFWRDFLIAVSYEVPTRVDVRRFYDMRTIDVARLREMRAGVMVGSLRPISAPGWRRPVFPRPG
jgi:hypothetical protein